LFDGVVEIRNEIERSLGVEMRIIGVTGDTLLHSITDGAFGIPDMQFWKFLLILREIKLLSLNFPESISHQDNFADQEAREDKEDVYSKIPQRKPTFVEVKNDYCHNGDRSKFINLRAEVAAVRVPGRGSNKG
tara:strand:+ start:2304 stop:2702 length:399 start_codon:yes stop_codon:yes gene_type:complete